MLAGAGQFLVALVSADALTKIVSFAVLNIYASFQMVVLAALRARIKGWRPAGEFRLGRWGLLVNGGALAYGVFAIANISWPRTPPGALVRQLDRAAVRRRGPRVRAPLHVHHPPLRPQ